jgi:MFS family permease
VPLRRILGADIDRELLPVLAVTLVSTAALSAHFGFQGIYAIRELGASPGTFAWALLAEAALTVLAGYTGGRLSDRFGRRRVMLASWGGQALALVALAAAGQRYALGLGLIVLAGMLGGPARAAAAALIADIVPETRHEAGYAAQRVAENLGVAIGPPVAGLVLLTGSWAALFLGAAGLVGVALVMGARLLPERRQLPRRATPGAAGPSPLALIRRDRAFLLFLVASTLSSLAFIASETVLPIAAVTLYGLTPSIWGLIATLNPLAVVLLQLRITRWTGFVSTVPKLLAAMFLMGAPLLLLPLDAGVGVIVVVIAVFVVGEMLWVPSSQAIIARLAPADIRGAYMGAVSSTSAAAFAVGPLIGLQLLDRAGDTAMWAFYAVGCALAGFAGAAAARAAERRPRGEAALSAGRS